MINNRSVLTLGLGLMGFGLLLFFVPLFGPPSLTNGLLGQVLFGLGGLSAAIGLIILVAPMVLFSGQRDVQLIALAVGGLALILIIGATLSLMAMFNRQNTTLVTIDAPAFVQVGDEFQVLVTVENNSEQTLALESINISDNYLQAAALLRSSPNYFALLPAEGYQSYVYALDILAGETQVVALNFTASQVAAPEAGVSVCINTNMNCVRSRLNTEFSAP